MMAHANLELIQRFYAGFAAHNSVQMNACYHREIIFHDPVFSTLDYEKVTGMWDMLCQNGKDLIVTLVKAEADDHSGTAEWTAEYTFSATGRYVQNQVTSKFGFKEGLILTQKDDFDLWKWTRMALGSTGVLLGWTPMLQKALQKKVKKALNTHLKG